MALKRISVVVFICFLSFADAEHCPSGDEERAKQACGRDELCITVNGKNVKFYNYSKEMSVSVECHYKGVLRKQLAFKKDNFIIKWMKNKVDITNTTKCRNLKTEIQLSPHTGTVFYTCQKRNDKSQHYLDITIGFIYIQNEPTPRSTSRPTPRPTSRLTTTPTPRPTERPSSKQPAILDKTSATIKVAINGNTIGDVKSTSTSVTKYDPKEADYYYFNHELVNVTCALVITDHNPKSSYLLEAHNSKTCIDGNINGAQLSHTQELTASVAKLNYQCNVKIGDKADNETCVETAKRALFTLQFMFAKLMMYINNEVKEEETTENGSEIVYIYSQEDITIYVKCSYAEEVYNRRNISHDAIIWDIKQLNRTYKDNLETCLKNQSINTIVIPLFADQSNSFLDCVENLGNQVSINKEYQPTRIRLRFIYAKLRMYIDNNNVTEKQKTTNVSEVVYKYKKENVTVVAKCSHGAEVYRIPRYNMSHIPIKWITENLDSTYRNKENTTLKEGNSMQIRLFADQNGSIVECVDNLFTTSHRNSIRLKFIYDKEVICPSAPKDAEPNNERDQKDDEPNKERDQKDVEARSTCDPKDAERAMVCDQKELCITIDNKIVTSYSYSQEMDISVVCHYKGRPHNEDNNFTIHWKNGDDVISNEGKCGNLEKVIHLSPDTNQTVYTCEKYSNASFQIDNITEDITFLYVPEDNLTLNQRFKSFFESNWVVLAAGLVLIIVIIAVIVAVWVVLKSRKSHKEDKTQLNPKGSRESLDDIPKQYRETPLEPKLNEQYTDLNADTFSEVYSDPYSAQYTQPIPKNLRKTKVLPELPPKPRNLNYLNTSGIVYEEPSTYNYINSNTRRIAENTGATYDNIDKSSRNTGATYNYIGKSSKNTGSTYNNIGKSSKHNGATYKNIDKSLKNTERVHFYDNMAACYANAVNEHCSSDVYSEPGLYEEPS